MCVPVYIRLIYRGKKASFSKRNFFPRSRSVGNLHFYLLSFPLLRCEEVRLHLETSGHCPRTKSEGESNISFTVRGQSPRGKVPSLSLSETYIVEGESNKKIKTSLFILFFARFALTLTDVEVRLHLGIKNKNFVIYFVLRSVCTNFAGVNSLSERENKGSDRRP